MYQACNFIFPLFCSIISSYKDECGLKSALPYALYHPGELNRQTRDFLLLQQRICRMVYDAMQGSLSTLGWLVNFRLMIQECYLNAVGDGLCNKGHISLDFRKFDTRKQRRIVVIAPKLPDHKQGLAEVILAVCNQHITNQQ